MLNQFSRTELLFGKAAMEKLENSRVAVFGIGGVGGYVCEALVRSGVGHFDLIDDDQGLPDQPEQADHCHEKDDRPVQDGRDERADAGDQSQGGRHRS